MGYPKNETSYIQKLIAEGEHQKQDFKFAISDIRKIAKSISAFSNTEGGRLLIGVKDNGKMSSRYVFLFLQYSVTLFLMILSVYFQRHFDFLINSSHGYETEDILVAQLYNHNRIIDYRSATVKQLKERSERINNVKRKLDECPMIERWMNSSTAVWDGSPTPIVNDKDETFELQSKYVTMEFFNFWGLEIDNTSNFL